MGTLPAWIFFLVSENQYLLETFPRPRKSDAKMLSQPLHAMNQVAARFTSKRYYKSPLVIIQNLKFQEFDILRSIEIIKRKNISTFHTNPFAALRLNCKLHELDCSLISPPCHSTGGAMLAALPPGGLRAAVPGPASPCSSGRTKSSSLSATFSPRQGPSPSIFFFSNIFSFVLFFLPAFLRGLNLQGHTKWSHSQFMQSWLLSVWSHVVNQNGTEDMKAPLDDSQTGNTSWAWFFTQFKKWWPQLPLRALCVLTTPSAVATDWRAPHFLLHARQWGSPIVTAASGQKTGVPMASL